MLHLLFWRKGKEEGTKKCCCRRFFFLIKYFISEIKKYLTANKPTNNNKTRN
jgi:hypothetical protein